MPGTLELTDDALARIQELQALSDKAENGDQDARRELRRAVKESPRKLSRGVRISPAPTGGLLQTHPPAKTRLCKRP
jgi:hypothetical protein